MLTFPQCLLNLSNHSYNSVTINAFNSSYNFRDRAYFYLSFIDNTICIYVDMLTWSPDLLSPYHHKGEKSFPMKYRMSS